MAASRPEVDTAHASVLLHIDFRRSWYGRQSLGVRQGGVVWGREKCRTWLVRGKVGEAVGTTRLEEKDKTGK